MLVDQDAAVDLEPRSFRQRKPRPNANADDDHRRFDGAAVVEYDARPFNNGSR